MVDVLEKPDLYQRDFELLQRRAPYSNNGFAWLQTLREEAMHRFTELGFPTIRDEEWRFTNARAIATTPFELSSPDGPEVTPAQVERFALKGAGNRLVFIEGHFRPELSRLDSTAGLRAMSLAEAIRNDPERVREHLARYADHTADAFAALNTAFLEDGAYIELPRGLLLDAPIHLLFVSAPAPGSATSDRPRASHPRNLIALGRDTAAAVVEHYVALQPGVSFSNSVTEVCVGAGARLAHYMIEDESDKAYNVSLLRVHQERGSSFESHTALFGGALVRNNVHVELQGEHCHSLVNGLFVGRGQQHMDNHMRVVHAKPHGDSRQFYKGVLSDRAHGVFTGRIVVQPGAQKTDAKQTNRNLLLSDDAQIDTRPQLEIYADDVKCTHGATTGRLDEEAIFYLESRGVEPNEARAMLIHAFANESLERMKLESVRCLLEAELLKRLPHAEALGLAAVGCE